MKTQVLVITTFLFLSIISTVSGQFSESRNITSFRAIHVDGPFDLSLSISNNQSLLIKSSSQRYIDQTETSVINGTLYIRFFNRRILFTGIHQVILSAKSVNDLIASGPAKIVLENPLRAPTFRLVASNSASISGKIISGSINAVVSDAASLIGTIDADDFIGQVSDAGTMTLSGEVENAVAVVSGSAWFHGKKLKATSISVTVSGTGRAEVFGVVSIKAVVTDLGVVRYIGGGEVSKVVSEKAQMEKDTP